MSSCHLLDKIVLINNFLVSKKMGFFLKMVPANSSKTCVLEISGYLCLMGIEIFKIEEEEEMKPNSWLATPLEK